MKAATRRMDDFIFALVMAILFAVLTSSCDTVKGQRRYPYPGVLVDPVTSNAVVNPQ